MIQPTVAATELKGQSLNETAESHRLIKSLDFSIPLKKKKQESPALTPYRLDERSQVDGGRELVL